MKLFGVELDDRLLADRHIDLLPARITRHRAGQIRRVGGQPRGNAQRAVILRQSLKERIGTALFRDRDNVAFIDERRRNVKALEFMPGS